MRWLHAILMLALGCGPAVGEAGEGSTGALEVDDDRDDTSSVDLGVDPETDGDELPPCVSTECTTVCIGTHVSVEACECNRAPFPRDYLRCDLGTPCGHNDRLCVIEAVRDGIVGSYRIEQILTIDDAYILDIDVLGLGRARAREASYTSDCCDGTDVNESATLFHPQAVVASDDAMWSDCVREGAPYFIDVPECLRPEHMFAGSCEPPLADCPG